MIIKYFLMNYFCNRNICLKINIEILSINFLEEIKNKNFFCNIDKYVIRNSNNIFKYVSNENFVNLFNYKNLFSITKFNFKILPNISLSQLEEIFKIYLYFVTNAITINFNSCENETTTKYEINKYLEEIELILWLLKFFIKTKKFLASKKYIFLFTYNSFNIVIKKDTTSNDQNIFIKNIMIYMGINHYKEDDLVKYFSFINNFLEIYSTFKNILIVLENFKNFEINIKLFKSEIENNELQYYFSMLLTKIENYISEKKNEFIDQINLYKNQFLKQFKCAYLNIKISDDKNTDKKERKYLDEYKGSDLENPEKLKNNKNKIVNVFNKIRLIGVKTKENEENNDETERIQNKHINNFYKDLIKLNMLNQEETKLIIDFVKDTQNYFTEFSFIINIQINHSKNKNLSSPIFNIFRNFNNNKCIFILNSFSIIDIYIYLYDISNKIQPESSENDSISGFEEVMISLDILKKIYFKLHRTNRCNNHIGNVNFIMRKKLLISNNYYGDNKSFFNEDNKIYILDEYKNIDCILDDDHIILISNNLNKEKNSNEKNKGNNYFLNFYNTFLYEYDIIKYINYKKVRKYNKLDIIVNKKIIQIKNGQIQLKKISRVNNIDKLFKIKELFKYQNSYPLICLFFMDENEISNLSFFIFSVYEIFLSKDNNEITKTIIIKKIIKFFTRFKSSHYIPIIFNKKYFDYFLEVFNYYINKKLNSNSSSNDNNTTPLFSDLIFFSKKNLIIDDYVKNLSKNENIFNYLFQKISLLKIGDIKFNENHIGKIFRFKNIINSVLYLGKISTLVLENSGKIIIYNVNEKEFEIFINKKVKKVKFVELDKFDKAKNVHFYDNTLEVNKFIQIYNNINTGEKCDLF